MTCLLIVYIYLIKLYTQISEGGNDTQISSVTKQKKMSSVLAENILLYLTLFYLLFQSLKLQAVISGIHVVHV